MLVNLQQLTLPTLVNLGKMLANDNCFATVFYHPNLILILVYHEVGKF